MMKKLINSSLSAILVLSSLFMIFMFRPGQAEAIGSSRLFQDPDKPNVYYFVGMVYYEVWRNSAGTWTGDGKKPGDTIQRVDGGPYEFTFASGRKVKSVEVSPYKFNWKYADETFNTSRTGELAANNKQYYQDATSIENYTLSRSSPLGVGTNSVNMRVFVDQGKLEAARPVNRKLEEEQNGQTFAQGVLGYRYFFPTLFTIELEPEEGKAVVKHWTTTGQSLDGMDGFTDKEVKLEKDKEYNFSHTAPGEKYTYEGYKKSTVTAPSGGSRSSGDPGKFTYNGKYPVYYVYFYYKLKNGDKPEIPNNVCTPPQPGRTLEGKYMDPVVTGMIKADQRGSEPFDVLKGIPTSESLYGNVFSRDYLFQNQFVQMTGTCTYTVNVEQTWTLTWRKVRPLMRKETAKRFERQRVILKSYPANTRSFGHTRTGQLMS